MWGKSKSYAERLFDFPHIGPLGKEDAFLALQEPVRVLNVKFDEDALEEIFNQTKGYPYFLQEWGYQSWNLSGRCLIEKFVELLDTFAYFSYLLLKCVQFCTGLR